MYQFTVPENKRVRVIISSDTACEADDPFAIAHALLSPRMEVKAVIAEHFARPGSMEQSYDAACRLLSLMKAAIPLLHGQSWPKEEGEISEGAALIISEARKNDAKPLYVLCMGAVSTVAAALQVAPDIAEKLTIVTIGGRGYGKDDWAGREYNWGNDYEAVNAILKTAAQVWQVPHCAYATMHVGLAELQYKLARCGEVGRYLLRQMDEFNQSPRVGHINSESWSLGDNPSVGVVLRPDCGEHHMQQAWLIDAQTAYVQPVPGRQIRVYKSVDSRYVLEDLFSKLAICFG